MTKTTKSGSYEAVPATINFPVVPIPGKRPPTKSYEPPLDIHALRFPQTTLNESNKQTEELVRECQKCYPHNIPRLVRMVEDNPHLLFIPEIRKIWLRLVEQNRVYRPSGRPSGIVKQHPLYLAAVITELLAQDRVDNLKEAFEWCKRFGMAPSTAHDLWYRARSDLRFKPLFAKDEALARPITYDDLALIRNAGVLKAGSSASTTLSHSILGNVTVTVSAVEPKKKPDNT